MSPQCSSLWSLKEKHTHTKKNHPTQKPKKQTHKKPNQPPTNSTCKLENHVFLQRKGEEGTDFPTNNLSTPPALLRNSLTILSSLQSPLDVTDQPHCYVASWQVWKSTCHSVSKHAHRQNLTDTHSHTAATVTRRLASTQTGSGFRKCNFYYSKDYMSTNVQKYHQKGCSSYLRDLRTWNAQVTHVLSYRYMDTETLSDMPKVTQQVCGKGLTHIVRPHLLVKYFNLKSKFCLDGKEQPSLCHGSWKCF